MGLFGDGGAEDTIQKALDNLKTVNVPTAESMQVKLQQLVEAGVLTPEQAQTALQNSNAFDKTSSDNTGMGSELQALGQLQSLASQGGSDANEKADLANIISRMNATEKGANDAVLQNQAARGALTGGETLAAQLQNDSSAAQAGNADALAANAAAQNRTLGALNSLGSLGGSVQGQQYQQASNQASAANAINQFNAAQSNAMNQFNTQAANQGQQLNLANKQAVSNANVDNANKNSVRNADLIQNQFNNQMAKAGATVNETNALASQKATNAAADNAFAGNLIGGVGSMVGSAYGGAGSKIGQGSGQAGGATSGVVSDGLMSAAHGAMVPGHAAVPGDSPINDTVPAKLSPGEVVLPRSVVQQHDPKSVMSFLSRMRQPEAAPKTPHPHDVATVLHALGSIRDKHEGGAI